MSDQVPRSYRVEVHVVEEAEGEPTRGLDFIASGVNAHNAIDAIVMVAGRMVEHRGRGPGGDAGVPAVRLEDVQ